MDVLALVLAGHFVGDWIVQTDRQATNKLWPQDVKVDPPPAGIVSIGWGRRRVERDTPEMDALLLDMARLRVRSRSWGANQRHMLGYHLTMTALVAPAWHSWSALAALAVSWLSHSFIDRRWPVRWLMRHTGSAAFAETAWGVMAVDQALHLAILCVLVASLSAR